MATVFTGIIRELGRVESLNGESAGIRLRVVAPVTANSTVAGDSVAVNGVCLTAVEVEGGVLAFDAVPETLRRSSLSRLADGGSVNVEPAVRAGEPLGGHLVQGHVDGVGRVLRLEPEGEGARLTVEAPPELLRYIVEKGIDHRRGRQPHRRRARSGRLRDRARPAHASARRRSDRSRPMTR